MADSFYYAVSGATEIPNTPFAVGEAPAPELTKGENIITFIAMDRSRNSATCSFTVTLEDQEAPVIECLANSVVQVHPSGILPLIVNPEDVLDSIFDNCVQPL